MKTLLLLFVASFFMGCAINQKNQKISPEKIHKENLKVDKEVKILLPAEGLKSVQKERIAFLNVHDFPDSALLSAKTKMNPPDLVVDEAKQVQMDRAEILRQALEAFCDNCNDFEVLLPIEVLSEEQFNFFFDKIFLRQEVVANEIGELASELSAYDKLVLVLSSENHEKYQDYRKSSDVIAETETTIRSEVYVFDLKMKSTLGRYNLSMTNREAYSFPIDSESLTFFHFFYSELCKSLFMDGE